MSDRRFFALAILFGLLTLARGAHGELFEAMVQDAFEVNRWPCPYVCPDRACAVAPFSAMIENAWRRQNILADYHFAATTNELTPAGQAKVRWILTEAPIAHRTVFVRRADNPQQTAGRINAVRDFASKLPLDGEALAVVETTLRPAGCSAGWPSGKDPTISGKFQGWVPENRYLPDKSGASGGQGQ